MSARGDWAQATVLIQLYQPEVESGRVASASKAKQGKGRVRRKERG